MKTIRTTIDWTRDALPEAFLTLLGKEGMTLEDVRIFDIETTGLSPKKAQIYLIGMAGFTKEGCVLTQFFAENLSEESDVLAAFVKELSQCRMLVHFNGDRFDLPFVAHRCNVLHVETPGQIISYTSDNDTKSTDYRDVIFSYDLYKQIKPYRKAFGLQDCRLKTVERLLGIPRTDTMSGGELIPVYKAYCESPDEEALRLLLLHNADDIKGTLKLLDVLRLSAFAEAVKNAVSCTAPVDAPCVSQDALPFSFDAVRTETYTDFEGNERQECYLSLALHESLPGGFSNTKENIVLRCEGQTLLLRIPVVTGEMKHFFPDYRNYYYLPYEEKAVHKSVGEFVDRDFRRKAAKEEAFVKRSGRFLPVFHDTSLPLFRKTYKGKQSYIENSEALTASESELLSYALGVLQFLGFS